MAIKPEDYKTRLSYYRALRNMTQQELAQASGVSFETIRGYEKKTRDINKAQIDVLQKLATSLGTDVFSILDATKPVEIKRTKEGIVDKVKELINGVEELNDNTTDMTKAKVRVLLESVITELEF